MKITDVKPNQMIIFHDDLEIKKFSYIYNKN